MNAVAQQHDETAAQRRNNPAWRLLVAENAPLILGFLDRVFLTPNVRQMPSPELVDALDDHLWALRAADAEVYPKDAEGYLGDWVEKKWLRRWYPAGTDVPHYAPTSAVETAAAFALARPLLPGSTPMFSQLHSSACLPRRARLRR